MAHQYGKDAGGYNARRVVERRHPLKQLLNPLSDSSAVHVHRAIVFLAGLWFVATLLEAGVLVMVASIAHALSVDSSVTSTVGPFSLEGSFGQLLWWTVGFAVLSGVFRLAALWAQVRLVTRWEHHQRHRLVASFLDATWPVQHGERKGRLAHYAGFASRASNWLAYVTTVVRSAMGVAVLVAAAMVVEPVAAGLIIVLGLALFVGFRPLIRLTRKASTRAAHAAREVNDTLEALVTDSRERQVFGSRASAAENVARETGRLMHLSQTSNLLSGAVGPIYATASLLFVVVILWIAGSRSDLDMAATGATALLLLRSASYGQALQDGYQRMVGANPYGEQLADAISTYAAGRSEFGDRSIGPVTSVTLRGVTYHYDDHTPALADVDLLLRTGDRVGIVGPSGAGKSTLSHILLRLRRPSSGEHRVNGVDADDVSPDAWVRQIAFVPHDSQLVHGTVRENIAYHRRWLDDGAVERAARDAGLAAVIEVLPEGYDTMIGPTTRDLSGGQIQRLSIARALAGRPSLLVLDEPTSALDSDSERVIQDTLARLGGDTIVAVIAHRPSTIELCERIVVVEAGRIVADGSHAEVAAVNPYFRRMLQLRPAG